MPIKKGDFININYTCRVKESGEVVESTIEDVAVKAGLTRGRGETDYSYEPQFVIVGEGWVPKGLDEALEGLNANENKIVEIPPSKGYGDRDPLKIKLVPLRRFTREGVTPTPGMRVEVNRKPALVRSVGAGRVQVDFNHPLSGKTLIYDVTIKKIVEAESDKAKALIHRNFPELNLDKTILNLKNEEASIEIPEDAFFLEGLQLKKRQTASELHKYLGLKDVVFIERFRVSPPSKASLKKGSVPPGKE